MESKHFKEFAKHNSRNRGSSVLGFFSLQCDMEVSKLRASMGDSIKLYSARTKAQAALGPQEVDVYYCGTL